MSRHAHAHAPAPVAQQAGLTALCSLTPASAKSQSWLLLTDLLLAIAKALVTISWLHGALRIFPGTMGTQEAFSRTHVLTHTGELGSQGALSQTQIQSDNYTALRSLGTGAWGLKEVGIFAERQTQALLRGRASSNTSLERPGWRAWRPWK